MVVHSAVLLLYRLVEVRLEVLVAHMGGPYWAKKEEGAWSIPKGEYDPDSESSLDAARREFREELGIAPPDADYAELGTYPTSSGKRVVVFVADGGGLDLSGVEFGTFEMEWPPRSGARAEFPEVDRVLWHPVDDAIPRLVKGQRPAVEALREHLDGVLPR